MKYYIIVIFIKLCLNQIIQKSNENKPEEDLINKEATKLEINYNIFNDSDIQIIKSEDNSNEKKFILNEQTYIIYPSNNKLIEEYSSLLSKHIKNNTGINIGVTPNIAMKMTNKIKNNFIQLIIENKNNENINDIVKININHRKILIKAKEIIGINQGVNIIKRLLYENNASNKTFNEIHFSPIQIIYSENIKNSKYVYFCLLIAFILIIFSFCFMGLRRI